MIDELANIKKKYEVDHKSWVDEKKTLEGENDESDIRMKTWKTSIKEINHAGDDAAFLVDLRMVSPSVVVLVDSEGWADMAIAAASSFRRGVVSSLEYYSMILELLDVSTAGEGGEWVRRIRMMHLRPKPPPLLPPPPLPPPLLLPILLPSPEIEKGQAQMAKSVRVSSTAPDREAQIAKPLQIGEPFVVAAVALVVKILTASHRYPLTP
ncbi:hypothetical protein LR48_Vigan07g164000 [Vigna angularis]|uniref:Uncharacterized protein n=1 Tax=Phaseolus angularis TaxID=3914 RepID=A0A0L9UZ11_PHAAN|nr:hypothetical protein LR48_Vigan07g164000 [Vigna angularis]